MTNKSITATDAKNRFAEMVDLARLEAITITRNERAVAIVLSPAEYSRLTQVEDKYWGDLADKVTKKDFVGVDDSSEFLNSILNEKNWFI